MSEPQVPSITFRVNLSIPTNELIGPLTNSRNPAMLHPDQHQEDPDTGRSDTTHRANTRSTWFPNNLLGNRQLKHGDEFTVTGLKALYIRDTYAVGYARADMAILDII